MNQGSADAGVTDEHRRTHGDEMIHIPRRRISGSFQGERRAIALLRMGPFVPHSDGQTWRFGAARIPFHVVKRLLVCGKAMQIGDEIRLKV